MKLHLRRKGSNNESTLSYLSNINLDWAVCGGDAIDMFVGHKTRDHKDIDIAVFWDQRDSLLVYLLQGNWRIFEPENDLLREVTCLDDDLKRNDNLWCISYVKWRISEQAAAAGNGIYLGPETFTEYEVDESKLPRGAAFGVPISGDSMEPEYKDGEIAIISKDFPEVSQVGLFTYDGNGYIKKLGEGVLESLNHEYDDILITDDVIINGRVIGVITWDDVRK